MFGTILADRSRLSEEEQTRYHGAYCGLCKVLKREYGMISRMTLSYDMTFLILLHSSLYEPEEVCGKERCMMHPSKKRPYFYNKCTSYAAAMNTALCYYKCLDDWKDEKKFSARLMAHFLKPAKKKVFAQYPEKCRKIQLQLEQLADLENRGIADPDAAAKIFGVLTGELFVADNDDRWAASLRRIGELLGQFIYLMDAWMDLEKDCLKGRYNPLKPFVEPSKEESFLPVLHGILGDCIQEMDKLPLVQDIAILKNILYSGVWIPYHTKKKNGKEG